MDIRALRPNDIDKLRDIYEKYYSNDFLFPDFLNNFLCAFVVTDDNNNIITGGGIRLIAESVIVTDQNYPIKERRKALYQVLDASEFITRRSGLDKLHAVTDNNKWKQHLNKVGFHSRGSFLVLDL